MLKEIVLPPVDMKNFSAQPIDTNLIIMSHDFNANELVIPFYETNVFDTYEAFYSFQGNTSIIIQEVFNQHNEIRIPIVNDVRRHKGIFTIELNASSKSTQATLLKLNVMVKRSNIDSNSEFLFNHYYKLFEDYEKEIAELNNATQSTIKKQLKQSQENLQKVSKTLIAINDKVMVVNDTADGFIADVATKQSDVTSKYNAFDTDITEANQTIDELLALQPQFQAVLDETTGKDVISAPEIILARNGEADLKTRLDKEHQEVTTQLTHIAYQLPANTLESSDITTPLQNLINQIKTTDHTEGVPTNTVKGEIKLPAGKYIISETVIIPSNIKITGAGKNTTVLMSTINNGGAVFHVNGGERNGNRQFFHNSFEGFTIHGQYNNCVAIRMDNTSRWSIKDVMLNECNYEGLYLYESYLGDVFGLLVRACGDLTHASVVHDGQNANNGTHAVTYVGGEIAGAPLSIKTIKAGVLIKQGMSNSFFGMTIEGFRGGYGIIEENGVSTNVQGCYFEFNEGNILSLNTEAANYNGNFMTLTEPTAKGFIVIDKFNGGQITGNIFKESAPLLTSIAKYSTGSYMNYTLIEGNVPTGYPLRIDSQLNNPNKGNKVSTFDGGVSVSEFGNMVFQNKLTALGRIQLGSDPNDYLEKNADGTVMLKASKFFQYLTRIIVPQLSLSPLTEPATTANSLYVDLADNELKFKNAFNDVNKLAIYRANGTVTRPSTPALGETMFDTSINKAVWWDGSNWRDAMGTIS